MKQLHPAVRTGFIWAGVHQAWALVGLAGMWLWFPSFFLSGAVLMLADAPVLLIAGVSGFLTSDPSPKFSVALSLSKHLPEVGRGFADVIVLVILAGALQWFLIGYVIALRQARRQSQKQAR